MLGVGPGTLHSHAERGRPAVPTGGSSVGGAPEGYTPEQIDAEGCKEWTYSAMTGEPLPSGPSWFRIAWDRTIKPSDLPAYGWEANPWVWVIKFERISRPPEGKEDGNVYG